MDGWDWNDIDVLSGEWWLLLIALLVALVAFVIGYLVGQKAEERRWRRGYSGSTEVPPAL